MQPGTDETIQRLLVVASQIQGIAPNELYAQIVDHVSWLIVNDFNALVRILYQLDLDEVTLKTTLRSNPEKDAAIVITDSIIARQIAKWKTRQELTNLHSTDNEDADERW